MPIDGIFNIIKPGGLTSFKVVRLIRQLSGEKRVGHTGTLDPMATGVLPICLGQGTRIAEFMANDSKEYRADIKLGIATDTYDAMGNITDERDISSVTPVKIKKVLDAFRGDVQQVPPMYSAIKYKGKRLYQLAAAGIEVERKPRNISIFRLDFIGWHPPTLTIEVECSKGTYIRTLAHDIGQTLGCGAHIAALTRLRCGPFHINDGISLFQIENAFRNNCWQKFLYPIDTPLLTWKATIVDEKTRRLLKNGCPLPLEAVTDIHTPDDGEHCRAYSTDGYLIAILRWEAKREHWHPYKVFQRTV